MLHCVTFTVTQLFNPATHTMFIVATSLGMATLVPLSIGTIELLLATF